MKNAVFWGSYAVYLFAACFGCQIIANVIPRSLIQVTLMRVAIRPSETSVLKRVTASNIPETVLKTSNFAYY
jgi:hypothetical protein